jgi:hypothetical protein
MVWSCQLTANAHAHTHTHTKSSTCWSLHEAGLPPRPLGASAAAPAACSRHRRQRQRQLDTPTPDASGACCWHQCLNAVGPSRCCEHTQPTDRSCISASQTLSRWPAHVTLSSCSLQSCPISMNWALSDAVIQAELCQRCQGRAANSRTSRISGCSSGVRDPQLAEVPFTFRQCCRSRRAAPRCVRAREGASVAVRAGQ